MFGHLRRNLVAYLALFVALGGTSFAAADRLLPANSVGTKQLRDRAVTKKKIARSTLSALRGQRGLRGVAGPTGAKGTTGAQGAQGPPGPVSVRYVTSGAYPVMPGMSADGVAACPPGMVVTGGGELNDARHDVVVTQSDWDSSAENGPPDLWVVTVRNDSGSPANFVVDAICVKPSSVSTAAATHLQARPRRGPSP
jgi:hypothetical protein